MSAIADALGSVLLTIGLLIVAKLLREGVESPRSRRQQLRLLLPSTVLGLGMTAIFLRNDPDLRWYLVSILGVGVIALVAIELQDR